MTRVCRNFGACAMDVAHIAAICLYWEEFWEGSEKNNERIACTARVQAGTFLPKQLYRGGRIGYNSTNMQIKELFYDTGGENKHEHDRI